MVLVCRRRRLRASMLGVYCRSSIAWRTRATVSGCTGRLPFSTCDTVVDETPARSAMSRILAILAYSLLARLSELRRQSEEYAISTRLLQPISTTRFRNRFPQPIALYHRRAGLSNRVLADNGWGAEAVSQAAPPGASPQRLRLEALPRRPLAARRGRRAMESPKLVSRHKWVPSGLRQRGSAEGLARLTGLVGAQQEGRPGIVHRDQVDPLEIGRADGVPAFVACQVSLDLGAALRELSLIHISEPTRLGMISYAV